MAANNSDTLVRASPLGHEKKNRPRGRARVCAARPVRRRNLAKYPSNAARKVPAPGPRWVPGVPANNNDPFRSLPRRPFVPPVAKPPVAIPAPRPIRPVVPIPRIGRIVPLLFFGGAVLKIGENYLVPRKPGKKAPGWWVHRSGPFEYPPFFTGEPHGWYDIGVPGPWTGQLGPSKWEDASPDFTNPAMWEYSTWYLTGNVGDVNYWSHRESWRRVEPTYPGAQYEPVLPAPGTDVPEPYAIPGPVSSPIPVGAPTPFPWLPHIRPELGPVDADAPYPGWRVRRIASEVLGGPYAPVIQDGPGVVENPLAGPSVVADPGSFPATRVTIQPGQNPRVNPRARHRLRQPRPREREGKVRPRGMASARALMDALGASSEFGDLMNALWRSLPKDARSRSFHDGKAIRPGWRKRWADVWNNWDQIDLKGALQRYAHDQVADRVNAAGDLNGPMHRFMRKAGIEGFDVPGRYQTSHNSVDTPPGMRERYDPVDDLWDRLGWAK